MPPSIYSEHVILVVDDDDGIREMLSRRLEDQGYTVRSAADGPQALASVAESRPTMVLLDTMMPGMTGLEVLKQLRSTHAAIDLPIVMVTARTEPDAIVDALELGANDYITKPINFEVFLARLRTQLRSQASASARTRSALEIGAGTILGNRYRLDSLLGAGNFGAVYRARHLELEMPVAVKVLQARAGDSPRALARFRQEAMSSCRVRHPNAVTILDFVVEESGLAYLVMELLEGRTLRRQLEDTLRLPPDRCIDIMAPVLAALSAAHESGIVHRDVKPANIFLHRGAQRETPKVLDFGIAKLIDSQVLRENLTLENMVIGTPAYMAPERLRSEDCDDRTDIYSVGVTLYEMLAGRLPILVRGSDAVTIALQHVNEKPEPLGNVMPGLSKRLVELVMQALAKNPDKRPGATEMERRLIASRWD